MFGLVRNYGSFGYCMSSVIGVEVQHSAANLVESSFLDTYSNTARYWGNSTKSCLIMYGASVMICYVINIL